MIHSARLPVNFGSLMDVSAHLAAGILPANPETGSHLGTSWEQMNFANLHGISVVGWILLLLGGLGFFAALFENVAGRVAVLRARAGRRLVVLARLGAASSESRVLLHLPAHPAGAGLRAVSGAFPCAAAADGDDVSGRVWARPPKSRARCMWTMPASRSAKPSGPSTRRSPKP